MDTINGAMPSRTPARPLRLASQPAKYRRYTRVRLSFAGSCAVGDATVGSWRLGLRPHNRTLDGEALDLDFAAFVDREVARHRRWVKALAGEILDDLARPDRDAPADSADLSIRLGRAIGCHGGCFPLKKGFVLEASFNRGVFIVFQDSGLIRALCRQVRIKRARGRVINRVAQEVTWICIL